MKHITVVISTNCVRPQKLFACLSSIKKSTYKSYKVIVLQQSNKLIQLPKWVKTRQIPLKGVSFSKNIAIRECDTEFIAFTDDDCIVDRYWIERIVNAFTHSLIDGVYGKAVPYKKTQITGHYCPSYVLKSKKEVIHSFSSERTHFGIGCNMAFRTNVLRTIHGFVEWLGPGSVGLAAEDTELLFRLLKYNHSVLYDPKIIIHHDRWLSGNDNRKQYDKYFCGFLAAYSYHMCKGDIEAAKIVKKFWKDTLTLNPQIWLHSRIDIITFFNKFIYSIVSGSYYIKGIALGVYFSAINRYIPNTNVETTIIK